MKTLSFKSTLNCQNCVNKVQFAMDSLEGIQQWNVDFSSSDKMLTVKGTEELKPEDIIEAIDSYGFEAVLVNEKKD